ncbi:YkvA family protein [Pontibacter beigongshangensis]|uniref:YkvA family protein n=1 Tax=Pontibacter beigongshangensis TaxID=2574733 RepID=UPI00164FE33B|nr:YkvA family protein [Pontibacter beigongshangensis]
MENQQQEGKKVAQSPIFKNILKKAEQFLQHPMQVTKLLADSLKKAATKKNIGTLATEAWENLQVLSRMIKAAMAGEYKGIPTSTLVGGIAVFIYFLTPIDLIPDVIPVIGLLDDATLLAWFMTSIKSELDRFNEWEATKPAPAQEQLAAATASLEHNADSSFGTPKYSDQPAGTVQVDDKKDY